MDYILANLDDYNSANEEYNIKLDLWRKEIESRKLSIKVANEELEIKKPLIPDEIYQNLKDEIDFDEKQLNQYIQKRFGPEGDWLIQEKILIQPIQDEVLAIVQKIAEKNKFDLNNSIIIETGGMKGSREEIDKEDLHKILSTAFKTNKIHSEYAMTELMSQSYSLKNQIFSTPAWKKILIKDFNDPMNVSRVGRGFLNIIDLANKYSCPFISTEDVGEVFENGEFKLFGRGSQADLRGCNLMLADTN